MSRHTGPIAVVAALVFLASCGGDSGESGGGTRTAGDAAGAARRGFTGAPGAVAVHDGPPDVYLIGLDGADWEIIDRLGAEGRLPNLERLRREGAWGVLRSEEPLLSPVVWTTIATGRSPLDHGIVGFLTSRDGATEPVRSEERRVRAFWNILGDLGSSVGVIGWYASWPAETVNGFLVSDRLGGHQVEGAAVPVHSGLVSPESLLPEVERARDEVFGGVGPQQAARYFSTTGRGTGGEMVRIDAQRLDTFVEILRTTELYRRLAPSLVARFEPALFAVYFEGTDAVGHLFAEYAPPPVPGTDPDAAKRFGKVFDRYYEHVDEIVGELTAGLDPAKTTLMILSDHGFKTGARRPATPSMSEYANQAPLWHRPEGIVLLWGRDIRPGTALPEAGIYDVLPTVLRLMDLPLSEKLKGKPMMEAFDRRLAATPVRRVADYEAAGGRETAAAAPVEPGDDRLAKLRALGYIGGEAAGGEGKASRVVPPAGGNESPGQGGVPLNRYNEGLILMNAGRRDEAAEVFRALQRDVPSFPLGWLGEGLVLLQERKGKEAIPVLEKAVRLEPRVSTSHASLGEAYLLEGRTADARASLEKALELEPTLGRTALLLGQLLVDQREFNEAEGRFVSARRDAPVPLDRAAACVGLAVIAEERRKLDDAVGYYEEALRIERDFPPALERYANLQLYMSRPERAVELLSRLVAVRPGSASALALYGRALGMSGRRSEARAALERSLALDPSQPETRAMLSELKRAGS